MNEVAISQEIKNQSNEGIKLAEAIVILNQTNLEYAALFVKSLAKLKKNIIETFRTPKDKAWETHKAICAAEKKHLQPVEKSKKIVGDKMAVYFTEQERIAEEEAEFFINFKRGSIPHIVLVGFDFMTNHFFVCQFYPPSDKCGYFESVHYLCQSPFLSFHHFTALTTHPWANIM